MTWTHRLDPAEAAAVRDLARRSTDEDGVALHLPRVWQREDPWAGLDG